MLPVKHSTELEMPNAAVIYIREDSYSPKRRKNKIRKNGDNSFVEMAQYEYQISEQNIIEPHKTTSVTNLVDSQDMKKRTPKHKSRSPKKFSIEHFSGAYESVVNRFKSDFTGLEMNLLQTCDLESTSLLKKSVHTNKSQET